VSSIITFSAWYQQELAALLRERLSQFVPPSGAAGNITAAVLQVCVCVCVCACVCVCVRARVRARASSGVSFVEGGGRRGGAGATMRTHTQRFPAKTQARALWLVGACGGELGPQQWVDAFQLAVGHMGAVDLVVALQAVQAVLLLAVQILDDQAVLDQVWCAMRDGRVWMLRGGGCVTRVWRCVCVSAGLRLTAWQQCEQHTHTRPHPPTRTHTHTHTHTHGHTRTINRPRRPPPPSWLHQSAPATPPASCPACLAAMRRLSTPR
jgi:hypothetical protein